MPGSTDAPCLQVASSDFSFKPMTSLQAQSDVTTVYHITGGVGYVYTPVSNRVDTRWGRRIISHDDYIFMSPGVAHVFATATGMTMAAQVRHSPSDQPTLPDFVKVRNATGELEILLEATGHQFTLPKERPASFFEAEDGVYVHMSSRWYRGVVDSAVPQMPNVCVLVHGVKFEGLSRGPLIYTTSPQIWPA